MVEWFEEKLRTPEDEAAPFVLNYDSSQPSAEHKFFRFAMTSKILLLNGTKSKILHIDATYKLIWQGFPVLVIGCTDKEKSFHPIAIGVSTNETQDDFMFMMESIQIGIKKHFDEIYAPNVLVSDAAPAISNAFRSILPGEKNLIVTCYAHVMANLKKQKLQDKSSGNWQRIKNDITHLQLAPSKVIFKKAQKLFIEKYQADEPDFCTYIRRNWFEKNANWYEGAKHFTPSTNNAIIKRDHTQRKRFSCSAFKKFLMEMVQALSEKYVSGQKIFHQSVEISMQDWRHAVDWVKLNRQALQMQINGNKTRAVKIYVESSQFEKHFDGEKFSEQHIEKYTNLTWDCFYWSK